MPRTDVVFYREDEGDVPVLHWLKELRRSDRRAYQKCIAAIHRPADLGHELRRPLADILRDDIHELRIRGGRVNLAILGHALTKEDRVPAADIDRAIRRKMAFMADPERHTYSEEEKA